jgi:hypothetical protein
LSVSNASAWGLFNHCGPCYHRGHHCFETHITCRPYNAFTPICWGNLYCDGCCPNPCGVASGCNMMPSWGGGGYGGCAPGMPCAGYPMGGLPSFASTPWDAAPGSFPNNPYGPQQSIPMQVPTNNVPPGVNTTMYGNPGTYYGVQPANYYPGYYYGYPMQYYPGYPAMPYGYGNAQQRPY